MRKLASHIVEIEVPDDFPSGHDPEAVFEYVEKHPEIGDKIIREYRKAYHKWLKNKNKDNAPKTPQHHEAKARSAEVSAPAGD
jgi:hypothetical protein